MQASCFDALLCRLLIGWPARIADEWPQVPRDWQPAHALGHFHDGVCAESPGHSDTDIVLGLQRYLKDRPGLRDWYQHLLALEGIEVDWLGNEPRLPSKAVARWQYLCNFLDADTLLAFDFARKHPNADDIAERIANWRTVVRCSDYDLDSLLARGVSDLHVHVGGTRLPQAVWLDLMARPDALADYRSLARAYTAAGASRSSGEAASPEVVIQRARDDRARLTALVALPPERHPAASGRWWSWDANRLRYERVLLISAWVRAGKDAEVLPLLDRYTSEKHRFAQLSRQPAYTGETGLKRFSGLYFPRLKREPEREHHRGSHRFLIRPVGDACAYLLESTCLERVELRLAPMSRASDYWRYFKLWTLLEKEILTHAQSLGHRPVAVRFAIHFKRTLDGSEPPGGKSALRRKLEQVERASATLRAALACPRRGPMLAPIARIDVAGEERDMACAHFGPYLRLLRGDPEAANGLEEISGGDDPRAAHFTKWSRLCRRGLHRHSPSDRRLGLTIHAGEDFADRLDGLYQIASAIDACGLRSGDGIGHGLALVWGPERDRQGIRDGTFIRAGPAFDSLCWLLSCLEQKGREKIQALCDMLERTMVTAAGELFPELRSSIRHVDAMAVWRAWSDPLNARGKLDSEMAERMWRESITGSEVESRRDRITLTSERAHLNDAVDAAAKMLLRHLKQERIVVEMNPSSNLRISGTRDGADNPTLGIFRAVSKGLLACINTDNPGVFGTCIENEFALLLESGRSHMHEGKIRDLLERVRRVGMEQVNWR